MLVKRFVRGKSCGFSLDDVRSWEFHEDNGFTDVVFSNGTSTLFREDLREAILTALNTPVFQGGYPWGVAFNGDPNMAKYGVGTGEPSVR